MTPIDRLHPLRFRRRPILQLTSVASPAVASCGYGEYSSRSVLLPHCCDRLAYLRLLNTSNLAISFTCMLPDGCAFLRLGITFFYSAFGREIDRDDPNFVVVLSGLVGSSFFAFFRVFFAI